jgi:hypothetical protein
MAKAWDVVGYTFNGAAYCADHDPKRSWEMSTPIFSDSDWDHECETCIKDGFIHGDDRRV